MKKILVTGLCTLHWGRLQYGNIGNYYIIEPLFRQLHRVFPEYEILTTFQMTDEFMKSEGITVLPMDYFYAWKNDDIENAYKEYQLALNREISKDTTGYIECVCQSDLVIDVSGDMWGDNAEHVGHGRFLVDLYKMRTAQLLGTKTVLFAGTPGPFTDRSVIDFAKEVYSGFDLVINREPTSTRNLEKWKFESENVKDFACPAFLYDPIISDKESKYLDEIMDKKNESIKTVGFTIGGFNMPIGPYDMWPREDSQYEVFAEAIEYIINELNAKVILITHTNGFELPPDFKLINGRDYPILKQLKELILKRGIVSDEERLVIMEEPLLPNVTKSLIGRMDMMVTGRVHASVAAISQFVPTVFISYEKNFIPSTKMYGFADLAGVGELVCEPGDREQMIEKISYCYENMDSIKEMLKQQIPKVKEMAKDAFDEMRKLVNGRNRKN